MKWSKKQYDQMLYDVAQDTYVDEIFNEKGVKEALAKVKADEIESLLTELNIEYHHQFKYKTAIVTAYIQSEIDKQGFIYNKKKTDTYEKIKDKTSDMIKLGELITKLMEEMDFWEFVFQDQIEGDGNIYDFENPPVIDENDIVYLLKS